LSAVKTSAAASLPRYLAMTGLATFAEAASRYALKIAQELFPYLAKNGAGSRLAMVARAPASRSAT
jgi:hypothetical protein